MRYDEFGFLLEPPPQKNIALSDDDSNDSDARNDEDDSHNENDIDDNTSDKNIGGDLNDDKDQSSKLKRTSITDGVELQSKQASAPLTTTRIDLSQDSSTEHEDSASASFKKQRRDSTFSDTDDLPTFDLTEPTSQQNIEAGTSSGTPKTTSANATVSK